MMSGTAIASHLRGEPSVFFWIRAGAAAAIVAAAVQSIWDTALRMPANGVLFAVIAAIALRDRRSTGDSHGARPHSLRFGQGERR